MSRLLTLAVTLALCATTLMPAPSHAALLAPDTDPRTFTLDASDLGAGFRLNEEASGPRPNESASNRDDVTRYQQWGRLAGYHAQFEREASMLSSLTQTGVVLQSVSLYRTPQGADQAFGYSRERNSQAGEMLGTPMVGEASLAFRLRQQPGQMSQQGNAPAAEAVVVQFRKGNLVQTLVVSGPQGTPVLDEALAVARLAASRASSGGSGPRSASTIDRFRPSRYSKTM
jgi:hypothetical protein